MKIGIIAGMWNIVPPPKYGGIERMIFNLATELLNMGEDVTLFAPKYSKFNGKFIEISDKIFINSPGRLNAHLKCWLNILRAEKCDIYHNHGRLWNVPFIINILRSPCVHTFHSIIEPKKIKILQNLFPKDMLHFTAVSQAQLKLVEEHIKSTYWDVIYSGSLDIDKIPFFAKPESKANLVFVGRICPEKGADTAIEIARKSGLPLIMAGPVQPHYLKFFEEKIKPEIDGKLINYIGEITETGQYPIFGNALATLFPIAWDEPFSMVPVYSLALGTPVIAFDKGSVREIIKDGENGFVVNSVDDACKKLKKVSLINRLHCRKTIENRFTNKIMARNYLRIYSSFF